jgi:hypothetical protein
MSINTIEVTPTMTEKELDALRHKLLTPAHGRLITRSTRVLCEGNVKALYLKAGQAIRRRSYDTALAALESLRPHFNPAKDSDRPMIQQSLGGDLLAGWLRPRNPAREDWLRKADRDHLDQIMRLVPMVTDFGLAIKKYLPEYYRKVHGPASGYWVRRPRSERFKTLHKVKNARQLAMLKLIQASRNYLFWGTPFSTITLNHNLLFGAHRDGRNIPGTLSCLTALGRWTGGLLGFPRLGVSFDLRPGDLLIADTNREYHGTVGGVFGNRYSMVAYLHKSLLQRNS